MISKQTKEAKISTTTRTFLLLLLELSQDIFQDHDPYDLNLNFFYLVFHGSHCY